MLMWSLIIAPPLATTRSPIVVDPAHSQPESMMQFLPIDTLCAVWQILSKIVPSPMVVGP